MPSFNQLLARLSDMFGNSRNPTAPAIPFANRNMFIDGAFDSFTGTSQALSTSPVISCATMWYGSAGLGGTGTHIQSPMRTSPGAQYGSDSNPWNCLQHQQLTASTGTFAALNIPSIGQKIEGVQRLAGKSVTLSMKMWTDTPFTLPGVYFNQNMGTGGTPTANNAQSKAVSWAVTGTMRRFSVRLDLAALPNGVVLGTNVNDFTNVGIYLPPGWIGNLYTTEWQIEFANPNSSSDTTGFGGAPTAFEYRGEALEAVRVARYYQNNFTSWYGTQSNASDTYRNWTFSFIAQFRNAPAITISGTGGGSWSGITPTIYGQTLKGFQVNANFSNTTNSYSISGFYADARL